MVKRLVKRGATLLQKINRSLARIQWQRYRELICKRQAEILMSEEQAELMAPSDQLEEANAKRIEISCAAQNDSAGVDEGTGPQTCHLCLAPSAP